MNNYFEYLVKERIWDIFAKEKHYEELVRNA